MKMAEIGFVVRRSTPAPRTRMAPLSCVTWLDQCGNWGGDRRRAVLFGSRREAHVSARAQRVRSVYDGVTIRVVRLMVRVPG